MVYDCHIHMNEEYDKKEFVKRLEQAGVAGGIVFSPPPAVFGNEKSTAAGVRENIDKVIDLAKDVAGLYPFYWIDPVDDGADEQACMAAEAGVAGFKVICCRHYPQDDRAMKVYRLISKKKLPMLFHSGILYNPGPSGEFNRPCNFEHLMFVDGLRFAMAHISWPWCDELISVFGKWNSMAHGHKVINSELYIDTTPGTPAIYREDAFRKLLTVGYSRITDRIIFGTDASSDYNVDFVKRCISNDRFIFDKLNISSEIREKLFHKNLMEFLSVGK